MTDLLRIENVPAPPRRGRRRPAGAVSALGRTVATAAPASLSDDEIGANLRQHEKSARDAFAPNTVRAFKADTEIFTAWCIQAGRQALPASSETVAAFVDAKAASKAPATIRRYAASIAKLHRAAKLENPCFSEDVSNALKRMHRTVGRAQQQADGLSDEMVRRMLKAASNPTLRNLRNKALLTVAYVTMCRRSELIGLQFEDLRMEPDGFGTVVIRRSKTDQEGVGAIAPITPDATKHLRAWIEAAKIKNGPLFRAIRKGPRVRGAMGANDVSLVFKAMAGAVTGSDRLSAEEISRISGHSTRVGAANDLLRLGEQLPSIMQAGRWQSATMVSRYTAKQAARDGAANRIAHKRAQF